MKIKFFSSIDYILLLCVLFLITIGIAFIYSSGINSEGVLVSNEYIKQIIWFCIGFSVMTIMALLDYRRLERYSHYFFIFMVAILVYTRFFGRYVNGARSWLGIGDLGIQPSELMKIAFILCLARFLDKSSAEKPMKRFVLAICIMMVPMGLILLQPDLGTASVFLPIFLFMCFMADVPVRYLMIVFLTGMLTIIFAVLPIWETEILRKYVFQEKILLLDYVFLWNFFMRYCWFLGLRKSFKALSNCKTYCFYRSEQRSSWSRLEYNSVKNSNWSWNSFWPRIHARLAKPFTFSSSAKHRLYIQHFFGRNGICRRNRFVLRIFCNLAADYLYNKAD